MPGPATTNTQAPRRVRARAPSDWPPARLAQLLALRAAGASAGAIARQCGVSRSAVLAKMRRLRLCAAARGEATSVPQAGREILSWRQRPPPLWVVQAKPYAETPGADADI